MILIFLSSSIHTLMFENNDKYDVYIFYNHKRYLTNILYDLSNLLNFSIVVYFLSLCNKRVFQPLFFLSIISWISYFVNYNQIGNLILIPIYLLIVIYYNKQ